MKQKNLGLMKGYPKNGYLNQIHTKLSKNNV
jgi:hypothetical protein